MPTRPPSNSRDENISSSDNDGVGILLPDLVNSDSELIKEKKRAKRSKKAAKKRRKAEKKAKKKAAKKKEKRERHAVQVAVASSSDNGSYASARSDFTSSGEEDSDVEHGLTTRSKKSKKHKSRHSHKRYHARSAFAESDSGDEAASVFAPLVSRVEPATLLTILFVVVLGLAGLIYRAGVIDGFSPSSNAPNVPLHPAQTQRNQDYGQQNSPQSSSRQPSSSSSNQQSAAPPSNTQGSSSPLDSALADQTLNPFLSFVRYHPKTCAEEDPTNVQWDASAVGTCPLGSNGDDNSGSYSVGKLPCKNSNIPGRLFYDRLDQTGRVQFVNFTGPISKQTLSALVVLPNEEYQSDPLPVLYALHARDQAFEQMDAAGEATDADLFRLMLGFNGWFRDMMCALNDPRMKPHVFVVPLRGGDRMWMDCANPEACALETQIAKELVPYVNKHYANAPEGEQPMSACMGYSMGASGCLSLALKYPTTFRSALVQSPGVYPRFLSWERLTSNEGPRSSPFSTRSFLVGNVFADKEDYDSRNGCTVLEQKLLDESYMGGSGSLKENRPKLRLWFGQRDPYWEQDRDLFNCLTCNQMCFKYHAVGGCEHGGFFSCLTEQSEYSEYLDELYSIFEVA